MNLLRLWASFFLGVFLFFVCLDSTKGQTADDQGVQDTEEEILIFRTSPAKSAYAEGVFSFQVSAFSPILVVKVNGFAQMVTENADWAEFELPYFLKQGKNLFNIFVQTKNGQLEKEFIVTYEPLRKKEVDPPPLKGMIMISQTNSNNMLQAYEGSTATSAAKNDLLLSAAYSFGITEDSDVSLNGFIKFDRHQNRSLAAEEILFRQLSTEYSHKKLLGMNFRSALGQTVISVKDANPSDPKKAGEFREDVLSLFLNASGKFNLGRSTVMSIKLQFDSQNKVKTDTEDGTLTQASIAGKMSWEDFRFLAGVDSQSTGFKEPTKNYQTTKINAGVTFSWTPWVFGMNFQNSSQNYKNPDPATNVVVKNKKDEITVNSKYAYNRSNIFGADLKQIKQSSNDALRTYSENQVLLQYMWLF